MTRFAVYYLLLMRVYLFIYFFFFFLSRNNAPKNMFFRTVRGSSVQPSPIGQQPRLCLCSWCFLFTFFFFFFNDLIFSILGSHNCIAFFFFFFNAFPTFNTDFIINTFNYLYLVKLFIYQFAWKLNVARSFDITVVFQLF